MTDRIGFFTVLGGVDAYEFFLGSVEHHAKAGPRVVLDTTPLERRFEPRGLPSSVRIFHEPLYGEGDGFRYLSSFNRALDLAKDLDVPVLAHLDTDEFFDLDPLFGTNVLEVARDSVLEVPRVHWDPNGTAWMHESEYHRRMWPRDSAVRFLKNEEWIRCDFYDGNPEHHPIADACGPCPIRRTEQILFHHLHYAVGRKWVKGGGSIGGTSVAPVPWPEPLQAWKENGVSPLEAFR